MSGFWTGVDGVRDAVREVKRRKHEGAREGIWLALTNWLNVSNAQVPHEEGDLERDGEPSLADGDELRGAVSYGRSADTREYAVRQHEDMTLNHDAGRNAKFLENAMNSQRAQSGEIIAAAIRRRMSA